jgi:hypothetical protein
MTKKITIDVFEDDHRIEIKNEDGDVIQVEGFVLFAGDATLGVSVGIGHGCAADAAWGTAFHYANPNLKKYFAQLSAHIAKQVDPTLFNQELNAEEIEEMWEDEEGASYH